jgi:hypothetical protein
VLTLPKGNYVVGKGLLYSEILKLQDNALKPAILLPPRYRTHEQEVASVYGLAGVRETGLLAAFSWLKEWLGFRSALRPGLA